MKIHPTVSLLILCLLSISGVFAQSAQIDAILKREMKERQIPGLQVAVVRQGKIILSRSYGLANVEDSIPVSRRSIFAINSCTKAFTGVAVMQLVEEGKIDLSAPISRYLDSLPTEWQPVTIRQLLTHISGLPDMLRVFNPGTHGLAGVGDEAEVWARTKAMPMDFPTGEEFRYNQTNYVLLGKVIEKFSGEPFARFFRERQFEPAAMDRTLFADARDVIPGMAGQYRYANRLDGQSLGEDRLLHNYAEFPSFDRTASGLNSTAEDLAQWLIALQNGQLLTKAALKTLWTPGEYNNGNPAQWALGWMTKPRSGHPAVMATGGGRSAFFVYPEDDLAIVVLTNLSGASPEDFIEELAGCYNPEIAGADVVTALRTAFRRNSVEDVVAIYNGLKKANPGLEPVETDLNDWGYRLLSKGRIQEALAVFKLNVRLFPESWNTYDSYGEALLKNGRKEEAARMYRKSVEMNPDNLNGKRMLEKMKR